MRVALFTCKRDRAKAALATRTVPQKYPVTWIVDAADADMEVPPGVDLLVRPFNRGRNLWGTEAVLGVSCVLADLATEDGRVLKMDSDCLLLDYAPFLAGDLAGMAHKAFPLAAYGLAYSMSSKAALAALDGLRRSARLGTDLGGEDTSITTAALSGGGKDCRFPIGKFWETDFKGRLPLYETYAIHCGSTIYAPREGPRVAEEMVRLGNALGAWRRPA